MRDIVAVDIRNELIHKVTQTVHLAFIIFYILFFHICWSAAAVNLYCHLHLHLQTACITDK